MGASNSSGTHVAPPLLVPLVLVAVTLFIMVGFQTLQLVRERQALTETHSGQAAAYDEAAKVRKQFESVASGTAKLATNGNQNAREIVAALEKAGVNFNTGN